MAADLVEEELEAVRGDTARRGSQVELGRVVGDSLGLEEQLTIDEYIGFVTTMLLVFGIIFEFPVVLFALARVGVLNYRFLASRRRYAVLLIVVIAIVATPGGDPISPLLLSGTMYLLFELTLQLIRLTRR